MCSAEWDGLLCWPPTLSGASIKQPCPAVHNLDPNQYAYKVCLSNATWHRTTDYSRCLSHLAAALTNLPDLDLLRDRPDSEVTTQVTQEVNSTTHALSTSTTEAVVEGVVDIVNFAATDDLVATVSHGLSLLCLLFAFLTWLSLRLSDRLATRRYIVLVATFLAALLFHLLVLVTRCQSLALSWSTDELTEHDTANISSDHHHDINSRWSHRHAKPSTPRAPLSGYKDDNFPLPDDQVYAVSRVTSGQRTSAAGMRQQAEGVHTLCQVGRVLFHLADISVYSFAFALSLYYTVVVLGRKLTLNKLLTLFLLALGLPTVFVVFTILLYIFLPLGATTTTFTCTIYALEDEFHWATTGPKLLCLVLSLCLMTVCTYSFLRLHFPALHTSSETLYARQGVFKLLVFLVVASVVELLFLVTQYQDMHGHTTSPSLWLASTALSGVKGSLLALMLCFLDSEILHGSCCPTSDNVRESTVVLGERNSQDKGCDELLHTGEKKTAQVDFLTKPSAGQTSVTGYPGQGDRV
ncbi:hypothetical protein C0Q70_07978 [Pomacea canaliculata]|uniref:G-protein coupled receptors family 2 profile 1 domain-containing protein n=2 Tax=Pomacea canaliculata TaxID=400727 RepID=A0A2T7PGI3_POMCA|nr:hypothetical protein C0Q70_07978 [Pomacea canaliculata]